MTDTATHTRNPYLTAIISLAALGLIGGVITWLCAWAASLNAGYYDDGSGIMLATVAGSALFAFGVLFGFGVLLYGALTHNRP